MYGVGQIGDGTGAMFRPKGVGVDSEGHLYVVEGSHDMVQVFNREGQLLYYFGQMGTGFGDFRLPAGLFIDHSDRVFVVDSYQPPSADVSVSRAEAGERRSAVKLRLLLVFAFSFVLRGNATLAQITGDVIGMHDLSPGGGSPIQGARPGSCTYCHVPHSGNGNMAPLWNQTLSTATYQTYTSTTYVNHNNEQHAVGQRQRSLLELPRRHGRGRPTRFCSARCRPRVAGIPATTSQLNCRARIRSAW